MADLELGTVPLVLFDMGHEGIVGVDPRCPVCARFMARPNAQAQLDGESARFFGFVCKTHGEQQPEIAGWGEEVTG